MRSDEAILDEIIKDGSVNISEWPELLKRLLTRLEHIAHNSFPVSLPAPTTPALPGNSALPIEPSAQSTAIEAVSSTSETPTETPAEASTNNETTRSPDAPATATATVIPPSSMPPPPPTTTAVAGTTSSKEGPSAEDIQTLSQLTAILTDSFDTAPPYTIQRLAELLRYPTRHYKSLNKYLRALTRVLSVSSPSTVFPLEDVATTAAPNGAAFMLGSDESLGGALLSPIPWLTPTTLSEETMSQDGSGVSQGELLRTEQELGIAPTVELETHTPPPLGPEDVGPQPEGTVFADPPAVEEMGRVEEMRDVSAEAEEQEKEENLEDKMQLDAAADGKEEEARKEKEKEKDEEKKVEVEVEVEVEEAKDEKMSEA